MPTRRLSRDERKAETRDALLEAAAAVFARRGYQRASVDEVAEEAGYSTGALYSNFSGKEDLFLALLDRQLERQTRELSEALAERPTVDDRVRGGAREWMAFLDREPELVLLFMEFWGYAVREPGLRERFAEHFGDVRAALARLIGDGTRELGVELTIPVEQLAAAVDALANGFALQRLADPDGVPDELFETTLALLLAGATRPPSR